MILGDLGDGAENGPCVILGDIGTGAGAGAGTGTGNGPCVILGDLGAGAGNGLVDDNWIREGSSWLVDEVEQLVDILDRLGGKVVGVVDGVLYPLI